MNATALRVRSTAGLVLLVGAGVPLLSACPAMIAAGVVQGVIIANDERSTVAQLDDQTIEIKITAAAGERWGSEVLHLNVTSYNGIVLLTGEAPSSVIQDEITKIATSTEHVRIVQNEMVIGPATDLSARTNDTYITSKVKTRLLDDEKVKAIYIKVVTERSVVYLMGIVPRPEAEQAAQVAATTSGVAKVVTVFEYKN